MARTREQCLVSAGLWREHAAQAEEREKAELLKARRLDRNDDCPAR